MKRNSVIHLTLLLIAILTVFGIAHKTVIEVHSKEDLRTLTCGWPLEFVTNDQSWRDPPYPYPINCLSGELGDRGTYHWQSFFINVFAFYFSFGFLWEAYSFVKKRKKM
jgi:hypothetical protein